MIEGIRIQGKCFTRSTELRFFAKENQRIAVVYGRNGSGKSTISRGLAKWAVDDSEIEPDEMSIRSSNGYLGSLPSAPLSVELLRSQSMGENYAEPSDPLVLVYNEDYIDQNVKVQADGLGTVVLLGEQADIQTQIDAKKVELDRLAVIARTHQVTAETAVIELQNADSSLLQDLKSKWGSRSRAILASTIATPSWSKTREYLMNVKPAQGELPELITDLDRKIAEHRNISAAERIESSWQTPSFTQLIAGVNPELMSKTLRVPTGDGLRAIIARSLERFERHVHEAERIFTDTSVSNCPMCQQKMEDSYRRELVETIRNAVDDESEKFRAELERAKCSEFDITKNEFASVLGKELIDGVITSAKEYNQQVSRWSKACELKKTQLYTGVLWDSQNLVESAKALSDSLDEIEAARCKWNLLVDDQERGQAELVLLNDRVSKLESSAKFTRFETAIRESEQASQRVNLAGEAVVKAQNELAELVAQSTNVQIAADEINSNMQAIFAERERLSLELNMGNLENSESYYRVLNRGLPMRPEDLSIGERNILALTYFFTRVRRGIENLDPSDSMLVVLDDPISSVDVDNRLGIHGFIELQIAKILEGSENVRVLVLTHDLTAAREFDKSAISALPVRVPKHGQKNNKWARVSYVLRRAGVECDSNPLQAKELEKLNEYSALLGATYQYALAESGTTEIQDLTVGNAMRRVLEAFSTFIYRAGILDPVLSEAYSSETSGRVLSVDLRAGHRGFLHESSHAVDSMTALRSYGGMDGLDSREQVLHVRRVLAFMFTLQETHMRRHLPQGAEKYVKKWQKELLS